MCSSRQVPPSAAAILSAPALIRLSRSAASRCGSRSPPTVARRIRCPVVPVMSLMTESRRTSSPSAPSACAERSGSGPRPDDLSGAHRSAAGRPRHPDGRRRAAAGGTEAAGSTGSPGHRFCAPGSVRASADARAEPRNRRGPEPRTPGPVDGGGLHRHLPHPALRQPRGHRPVSRVKAPHDRTGSGNRSGSTATQCRSLPISTPAQSGFTNSRLPARFDLRAISMSPFGKRPGSDREGTAAKSHLLNEVTGKPAPSVTEADHGPGQTRIRVRRTPLIQRASTVPNVRHPAPPGRCRQAHFYFPDRAAAQRRWPLVCFFPGQSRKGLLTVVVRWKPVDNFPFHMSDAVRHCARVSLRRRREGRRGNPFPARSGRTVPTLVPNPFGVRVRGQAWPARPPVVPASWMDARIDRCQPRDREQGTGCGSRRVRYGKRFIDIRVGGTGGRFANEREGFVRLGKFPGQHRVGRVVVEATGRFHWRIHRSLADRGPGVCVTTPRQARDFAGATGEPAKTDRVDAGIPAGFGEVFPDLPPTKPGTKSRREPMTCRAPASGSPGPSRPCGPASAGPGTGPPGNRSGSRSGAWRKGGRCPPGKSADTPQPTCRRPTPSCARSRRRAGHGGGAAGPDAGARHDREPPGGGARRRGATPLRQRRQDGQALGAGRAAQVRTGSVYGRDGRAGTQRAAGRVPSKTREKGKRPEWRSSRSCESSWSWRTHRAANGVAGRIAARPPPESRAREIPGPGKPVRPSGRPAAPVSGRRGHLWITLWITRGWIVDNL